MENLLDHTADACFSALPLLRPARTSWNRNSILLPFFTPPPGIELCFYFVKNYHQHRYHRSFVQRINMPLIALIIARSQRVCCHCQCLGRQPELTAGERGHHTSLLVSLLCIITVIIMITWPKPRYVRQGLAPVIV